MLVFNVFRFEDRFRQEFYKNFLFVAILNQSLAHFPQATTRLFVLCLLGGSLFTAVAAN